MKRAKKSHLLKFPHFSGKVSEIWEVLRFSLQILQAGRRDEAIEGGAHPGQTDHAHDRGGGDVSVHPGEDLGQCGPSVGSDRFGFGLFHQTIRHWGAWLEPGGDPRRHGRSAGGSECADGCEEAHISSLHGRFGSSQSM